MLAIIGGSGFYQMDGLKVVRRLSESTPFGEPSAAITVFADGGNQFLFLPRHGENHQFLPSEVNYRANIFALKKAGARQIIAVSAVGSLRQPIAPGDFATPSQYYDHTKGRRANTFFGDGLIAHISTARPACPALCKSLQTAAADLKYTMHGDVTYACVEGPRLGTRAESFFLRDAVAADLVGMTNLPEVFLAREAQLCYATLAVPTDYDCWQDDPKHHVTVEMVIAGFTQNINRAQRIIRQVLLSPPPIDENYRRALDAAILTPPANRNNAHRQLLEVLLA